MAPDTGLSKWTDWQVSASRVKHHTVRHLFSKTTAAIVFLMILSHSNLSLDRGYGSAPFDRVIQDRPGLGMPGTRDDNPKFHQGQWIWVVSKATKSLNVYQYNGREWIKKKSLPMIYGEAEGDKQQAGDMRTPEGHYWVNRIFYGQKRGPRFGALVFSLNFPNRQDKLVGKTGGGIWIHGPEYAKGLEPSQGCVKLYNEHLLQLLRNCEGPIPVVILGKEEYYHHPSGLDLKWMEEEYLHWRNVYQEKRYLEDSWRKALYKKARSFTEEESRAKAELADFSKRSG